MGNLTHALTAPITRLPSDPAIIVGSAPEPDGPQTLFDHATVTVPGNNEPGSAVNLGVVFSTTTQGEIRAISFYKSAGDAATSRVVALFTAGGAFIVSGGTTGEPVGIAQWITVPLEEPFSIAAGVDIVAAVHYPQGSYPAQTGAFASTVTRGNLIAKSNAEAPGQGRYRYFASIANPTTPGGGASYGVDVDFFPDPPAGGGGPGGGLTPMSGHVSLWSGGSNILENVDLDGYVTIHMENCIVRNCRIRNSLGGSAVIKVDTNDTTGAGLLVENCEIDGLVSNINGIAGQGTFRNNTIVGVDNGINVYGPSVIEGNYIYLEVGSEGGHFDGIEINGASNITIRHNTIIVNNAQTAAIMMNNEFGALANINIIDNDLSGGGYTVYCDNGKNEAYDVDAATIKIQYNRLGSGFYGYYALYTSGVTPVGNVDITTGEPV